MSMMKKNLKKRRRLIRRKLFLDVKPGLIVKKLNSFSRAFVTDIA